MPPPEPTEQSLWIGNDTVGDHVLIELSEKGRRITLDPVQAETLAELLLHHARQARTVLQYRAIAETN